MLLRLETYISMAIYYCGVSLGALLLVDLQRVRNDPQLLGKVLAKVRFGRLGSLSIFLISRGDDIKGWAESIRDALSKNFDVTVYLYTLKNDDIAVKKVIDSCKGDDVVFIYRELSEELLKSVRSICNHIEIL